MARWNSCNVLSLAAEARRVWHFEARGDGFALDREQTVRPGEPLPERFVAKTWTSLWQKKLNIAWLPRENVFVRVAHFPQSTPEETRSMVEFQLEKLSPIPVTQALWSLHPVATSGTQQTVIVVIASRGTVEEFLGKLEGEGFLADRLELPLLDQLQATPITEDGAWIYPGRHGGSNTALVAWWYGGVLHNVDLLTLPAAGPERPAGLRDQVMQMAWGGELAGWLTTPPRWHLVAEGEIATEWEPALRQGLDQPIDVSAPLPETELAALTARRSARAGVESTLLPAEYTTRYHQQFVDRLWMRALGVGLGIYLLGLIVYFVGVWFLSLQVGRVESTLKAQSPIYTNALQLTQQVRVLKERQELKYAGLDCWEAVAETLPENVTIDTLNFSDGRSLKLNGSVPTAQVGNVFDFVNKLRKWTKQNEKGDPVIFFDPNRGEGVQTHPGPNNTIIWSFGLDLKRILER